jgi:hypothetical protein
MKMNRAFAGMLVAGFVVALNLAVHTRAEEYWSLQLTNHPPFPVNPFPDLPVYSLGNNQYLYDDLTVDYAKLQEEAELLATAEKAFGLSAELESAVGGGACGLLMSSCGGYLLPPVYQETNVLLTLANTGAKEVYDLFTVSNLNEHVWTLLERGTNGQTEFVVMSPPEFESYYMSAYK